MIFSENVVPKLYQSVIQRKNYLRFRICFLNKPQILEDLVCISREKFCRQHSTQANKHCEGIRIPSATALPGLLSACLVSVGHTGRAARCCTQSTIRRGAESRTFCDSEAGCFPRFPLPISPQLSTQAINCCLGQSMTQRK